MPSFRLLLLDWLRALGPWRLLFALATGVALACLGPGLAADREPAFDTAVLQAVHNGIPDAHGPLLVLVYRLSGKHVGAVLVLAVLIFLALRRFWADLICVMVGTGGILLIVDRLLKPLFDRARPDGGLVELAGRSFPSGHAAGAVLLYFLTCCLLSARYPRLRWPLFGAAGLWVCLVWLSTLYVRAHWLTDIVAGAALGAVWLSFCLTGFNVWQRRQACPGRQGLPPG